VKTIIGLLLMMLSAAAYGQVLKCVGQDGKVEFATVCPSGTTVQQTGIRNDPKSAPAAQQKPLAERDAEFRKRLSDRQEAATKAAKDADEAAQRKHACDSSRAYLRTLQSGSRVLKTDPATGERAYLQDAQYASETAKTQRAVDANCKE
jgi:hypothetical protein